MNPLAVLPELAVLGLLALGLPAAGGLVGLEGVDLAVLELEVGPGDAGALHDAGGALVPDGAEEVEADGAQAELVAEALEAEPVARAVQLAQLRDVEGRAVARLLEQEYRQPVVRRTLLGEGRQPGHGELGFLVDAAERERGLGGGDGHVDGEVVAAAVERIGFEIGHIGIHDDDGDKALAWVEALDAQTRGHLGDAGIENLAGLDLDAAEVQLYVHDRVELGQHIGDNV